MWLRHPCYTWRAAQVGPVPRRYCKIELELDDGTKLAFCDSRRFARANWQVDPQSKPPVSLLGPDILNDRIDATHLSKVRDVLVGSRPATNLTSDVPRVGSS